jgi:AcrR family transcriptional regulator
LELISARGGSLGQRERNKLDKLRRIKDAARGLFLAKGFDDTTTREIAIRAGVGTGTIFVYAENKRDLLFLIVNEELEKIGQMAENTSEESASLLDNLLRVARIHYEFFAQQPALSRFVLREMVFYESGAQAGRFRRTRERLIDLLGRIAATAMAQKSIAVREDPSFIGWTIFSVFQVELRRWLSNNDPNLQQGLRRLERALRLVITGLVPTSDAFRLKSRTRRVAPEGPAESDINLRISEGGAPAGRAAK